MGQVYIADAPGGDFQVYVCPNCSRSHPAVQLDDQGMPMLDSPAQPPSNCRRCGSPMDVDESKEFQEEYTKRGNAPSRPATRQTVRV